MVCLNWITIVVLLLNKYFFLSTDTLTCMHFQAKPTTPLDEAHTHTHCGYPLFIHGSEYSLALHSSFTSPQGVRRLTLLALRNTPYWMIVTTARSDTKHLWAQDSWVWKRTGPWWRAGHIKRSSSGSIAS